MRTVPRRSTTALPRFRQAAQFMPLLWGEGEGFACLAVGQGGRFENGTYTFRTFGQLFERWPGDVDSMASIALDIAEQYDVFVAPLLRATESREAGSGIPGYFVYADVDQSRTPEQEALLQALVIGGGFCVGSGRNRHVYIRLAERLPSNAGRTSITGSRSLKGMIVLMSPSTPETGRA